MAAYFLVFICGFRWVNQLGTQADLSTYMLLTISKSKNFQDNEI